MTKKQVVIGVGVGLLALGVLVHANVLHLPGRGASIFDDGNVTKSSVGGAQAIGSAGMADDRQLVGVSHYVFVGKIGKRIGNAPVEGTGATQYAVDVLFNIKGQLQGTVVIAQLGVSLHEDGKYTALEGQSPLQIGATYVFASRYGVQEQLYAISAPPFDRQLITQDATLDDSQLRSLAQSNERVKALQAAYPNEMVPLGEVRLNTDWNNYQSLRSGRLFTPPPLEPSSSVTPSPEPADSLDASVPPTTGPAGDMASPMASDMPLAS